MYSRKLVILLCTCEFFLKIVIKINDIFDETVNVLFFDASKIFCLFTILTGSFAKATALSQHVRHGSLSTTQKSLKNQNSRLCTVR